MTGKRASKTSSPAPTAKPVGKRAKTDATAKKPGDVSLPPENIRIPLFIPSKRFNEKSIKWSNDGTNFSLELDNGLRFYGWYRKTKGMNTGADIHCIDCFAKYAGREFTAPTLTYGENPLDDLKSLNADIASAAINWQNQATHKDQPTLADLVKHWQDVPTLEIKRLSTIDAMIMTLRELRDTCIKDGGFRVRELVPDGGIKRVYITANLTVDALRYEGKPPPLAGASRPASTPTPAPSPSGNDESKPPRSPAPSVTIENPENVNALLDQLKTAKASGDKTTARKIREQLRKLGHKGGARAAGF